MTTVKRSDYIFSIVSLSENFCFDESDQQRTILNLMILNLIVDHFFKDPLQYESHINMSTGVLGLVVKLQTLNLPRHVKLVPDASHAKQECG